MNWKSLLAVFITVGIIGLLMLTDVGKTYTQFLSVKVGSFLSTILNVPEGESFRILLDTDKAAFYGQSYAVNNVSMAVSGLCQSSVKVGNAIMTMSGKRCSVEVQNAQGQFDYTVGGSIKFTGVANIIVVNDYPFLPTGNPFEVSFEVIPLDNFQMSGITQSKIILESVSGSAHAIKGETELGIDNLVNNKLEISNFQGDMKLDGSSMMLVGLATSVKGTNFSW